MNAVKMAVKATNQKDICKSKSRIKRKDKPNPLRRVNQRYEMTARYNTNYMPYNTNHTPKYKFIPHTGSRWKIPSGITITESVKLKFEKLETYKIAQVFSNINYEFNHNIYSKVYLNCDLNFNKIELIRSYLTSLKHREQNEWKAVAYIYFNLFKVIRFMNKLVCLRRLHICMKKQINTEDIVTMEIPKNPIYVINYTERCTYVYEADTLRKAINNRLLMSDWMFDNAQYPLNLLSNEPFTMGQSLSIYNQMKAYGIFSWTFDRFKACGFNLNNFVSRFRQQLKIEAIESHFKNEYDNSKETVIDFCEASSIDDGLTDANIEKFKIFYDNYPTCIYNRRLKNLVMQNYIAIELKDFSTLASTKYKINKLIQRYLNDI